MLFLPRPPPRAGWREPSARAWDRALAPAPPAFLEVCLLGADAAQWEGTVEGGGRDASLRNAPAIAQAGRREGH